MPTLVPRPPPLVPPQAQLCHTCFSDQKGDSITLPDATSFKKVGLTKAKNEEEIDEEWVQCDFCEGWVHQICGMFNKVRNRKERGLRIFLQMFTLYVLPYVFPRIPSFPRVATTLRFTSCVPRLHIYSHLCDHVFLPPSSPQGRNHAAVHFMCPTCLTMGLDKGRRERIKVRVRKGAVRGGERIKVRRDRGFNGSGWGGVTEAGGREDWERVRDVEEASACPATDPASGLNPSPRSCVTATEPQRPCAWLTLVSPIPPPFPPPPPPLPPSPMCF